MRTSSVVETMVLVVLCLVISLLLNICERGVEQLRREEQQQKRQMEQREGRQGCATVIVVTRDLY